MNASQIIAKRAKKVFGNECKELGSVKMLFKKEVQAFIKTFKESQERAAKSEIVFKG